MQTAPQTVRLKSAATATTPAHIYHYIDPRILVLGMYYIDYRCAIRGEGETLKRDSIAPKNQTIMINICFYLVLIVSKHIMFRRP